MAVRDVIEGRHEAIVKVYTLDCDVDGDPAVNVAVPVNTFDMITRVIVNLRFATAVVDWSKFGNDTALSTGWYLYYDDSPLFISTTIKDNGDLFNIGFDVALVADQVATPNQVLTARWSFDKMSPWGLATWSGETFGATIQDDIAALASIDSFEIFVEGWEAHA
jgi:hypothetical protein